ncbi:MAG: hypothetical protein Ta2G_01250 [Termitinemataceae bacterium]|nr:MAG: hypothetical protein Ta2G_01250 [Termitinemataceae bacterium]
MDKYQIDKIIETGKVRMIEKFNNLGSVTLQKELHLQKNEIKPENIETIFEKKWKNVIYIFSAEKLPKICENVEEIENKFKSIKGDKNHLTRINKKHWVKTNQNERNYLYVGSCEGDPHKRMKQHLFDHSNTTYALHLIDWWPTDSEINIDVFVFGDSLSPVENLQMIEDLIWDDCKPLFGRKGHK